MAAAGPQYELGILAGGAWKQFANAAGQDYYQNLRTGATQYQTPGGLEDVTTDTWAVDSSKHWPQWRNTRTGRIRRTNPNPPAPRTYLDKPNVQAYLQLVERSPESPEYLYRRVIVAVLTHFFLENDGFEVFLEDSRGTSNQNETGADTAVLKVTARPGGSPHAYDYCLVESNKAENQSGLVYGIIHIGLHIKFLSADNGALTPLSDALHIRNDVDTVTTMFVNVRNQPLPFV